MSSTTPKPPSRATREEYDAWYEQVRAQCPPGASLPAYDPPAPPSSNDAMAKYVAAVCEHHELDYRFTVSDQDETDGLRVTGYVGGVLREVGSFGLASRDDAAAEVVVALQSWLPDECDACLGSHVVPGGWYAGDVSGCGECLGGGDDGEPPLTMAEREHEARRLAS